MAVSNRYPVDRVRVPVRQQPARSVRAVTGRPGTNAKPGLRRDESKATQRTANPAVPSLPEVGDRESIEPFVPAATTSSRSVRDDPSVAGSHRRVKAGAVFTLKHVAISRYFLVVLAVAHDLP